ncbi:hypothetical protein Psi02_57170 [Planotetraspora silvatica]|uniref:Transposase n=1 Tax=Planotetraspora silvatica TaxID=234614 RepID=A0A8J3XUB3_9ACTN|nr:hypothetical protein [Planotetraspora silvatica]GII49293.1 hypothetical protein Psi02_57170 [Planotetraspora silvatica]
MWIQQYVTIDDQIRWRTPAEQPPSAIRRISPYDGDARSATKRDFHWDGYKVHLTETCDQDTPHLIAHVITTSSPGSDYDATGDVHDIFFHSPPYGPQRDERLLRVFPNQ